MNQPFDSDAIAKLGWRQGAILDAKLAESARKHAPAAVTMGDGDWLIVTSHDCDVVNFSLAKEPVIEVMRAGVSAAKKVDKQQSSGRNPRTMQLAVEDGMTLMCSPCRSMTGGSFRGTCSFKNPQHAICSTRSGG